MTDNAFSRERIAQLSQKQLTLLALELKDQLDAERRRAEEPIAIVGLACRFPGGATSPDEYWRLMCEGRDAITEVPPDRWDIDELYDPDPDAPGKMSTRFGGFLDEIDLFDPELFGISPREAESMDPQQRLLLEVSWEALERAGIAPDSLRGSRAGVFVGVCNTDYGQLVLHRDRRALDAYVASGSAFSVVAGRVAYTLGLEGATMVIDTACSSSLVAIHEACQHLRTDGISLALAAGVNVICTPETTIALSKAHMMAPDGRCKTFDDSANGFVRAEGCGVLVLKRYRDAVAAGDRIHALIRGTAVNQDGRSSGLTVPNGAAQVRVIRDALAAARLDPSEVDYIEAHGTGTSLGDPIEIRALGEALCKGRGKDRPLYVGSVKTNIGHLESAAGVAGVIKAVLAIERGRIPPHLHLKKPNHDVAWSTLPIAIPTAPTNWPRAEARVAGVSSFGFSGTNAHVVLSAPPPRGAENARAPMPVQMLPLSARTPAALDALAARYAEHLAGLESAEETAAACFTASVGRAHLRERTAVVGADAAGLSAALRGGARIAPNPAARRAPADVEPVFLFTGFGAQTPRMGRALYAASPVFRNALDECGRILEPIWKRSLLSVIDCADGDADRLVNRTLYGQPALFAVEYALAMLWKSWGIEPAAVAGHSLGEYAAACVAGVFGLEDALALVAERSRLIDSLPSGGAMAAVFASPEAIETEIAAAGSKLDVAAVNGAASVVVSGPGTDVDALVARFAARGIESRRLVVSHAFHSALMEPMLDALEARAASTPMRAPSIPLYCNLTGAPLPAGRAPDAGYWRRHAREAVRFHAGVRRLVADGYRWFIEIGPHPTLLSMVRECVSDDALLVPSLRRGADEWKQILEGLATLYVHGASIDFASLHRPHAGRRTQVPTYPFERRRFWIPAAPRREEPLGAASAEPVSQPLARLRLDAPVPTFKATVGAGSPRFLFAHRLAGRAMVSAPLFAELALEAASALRGSPALELAGLEITAPLELSEDAEAEIYAVAAERHDGRLDVQIVSDRAAAPGKRDWVVHARAVVGAGAKGAASSEAPTFSAAPRGESPRAESAWAASVSREPAVPTASSASAVSPAPVPPAELAAAGFARGDAAAFYAGLAELGISLGPEVAAIRELWHGRSGDVVARLELPGTVDVAGFALHPALADAALQALGAAVAAAGTSGPSFMLAAVSSVSIRGRPGGAAWCRATLRTAPAAAAAEQVGDVVLYDEHGNVFAVYEGVTLRRAALPRQSSASSARARDSARWGYRVEWRALAPAAPERTFGAARAVAAAQEIGAAADEALRRAEAELDLALYDEALPALDALAHAHIVAALGKLGLAGTEIDAEALFAAGRIAPQHRRLFVQLLEILEQGGLAERHGAGRVRAAATAPPARDARDLCAAFPALAAEITLLDRCGRELADVLRGAVDPVALLFADGLGDTLRRLYRETPFALAMNRTLVAGLERALANVPNGRPVRIIEIGAGTGGTAAFVLPALRGRRVSYCFTDVSAAFLANAEKEFASFAGLSYRSFDVERDPAQQGFEAESFDIAIAANVIHATRDVAASMRHVAHLLAPGGAVLLLEGTTREPWVDLTFGLTDGWWRFGDTELRPSYPLLELSAWRDVLARAGFAEVQAVSAQERVGRGGSQALIVGRTREDTAWQASDLRRRWLIAGSDTSLGAALARILPGAVSVPFAAGGDAGRVDGEAARADGEAARANGAGRADRWTAALESLGQGAGQGERVEIVYVGARDADDESPTERAQAALAFLRAAARAAPSGSRVWLVTRNAVPTADAEAELSLLDTPLWGLGRGFALEHPDAWGGLIDLERGAGVDECAWNVIDQVCNGADEDQVAFRGGARRVARLESAELPAADAPRFTAEGAYLVTGGTGGLGVALARWLAEQGARHIVLMSRTGLPPRDSKDARWAEIEGIERLGAAVKVVAADVADRDAVACVVAALAESGTPLRGVVHAAAAMTSVPLRDMTAEQLGAMLAAKIDGALVLHELTAAQPLDFFVLFSSTTALLGVAGLAHYAAANQFLDVLAHYRRSLGLPALAVNWGTWDIMRVATEQDRAAFQRGGQRPMAAAEALAALGSLIAADAVQHTVADIDWNRLKSVYEAKRARPLLAHLATAESARAGGAEPAASSSLVDRLGAMPAATRIDALIEHVTAAVATVLKLDARRSIDVREGFFDLGMDSLMAVELKTRLEGLFGTHLPSTLTFDYPNIEALAVFLDHELFAGREAPVAETEAAPSARASAAAAVPPAAAAVPPGAAAVPSAVAPVPPAAAVSAAADVPADDETEDALEEQLAEKLSKLGL